MVFFYSSYLFVALLRQTQLLMSEVISLRHFIRIVLSMTFFSFYPIFGWLESITKFHGHRLRPAAGICLQAAVRAVSALIQKGMPPSKKLSLVTALSDVMRNNQLISVNPVGDSSSFLLFALRTFPLLIARELLCLHVVCLFLFAYCFKSDRIIKSRRSTKFCFRTATMRMCCEQDRF